MSVQVCGQHCPIFTPITLMEVQRLSSHDWGGVHGIWKDEVYNVIIFVTIN